MFRFVNGISSGRMFFARTLSEFMISTSQLLKCCKDSDHQEELRPRITESDCFRVVYVRNAQLWSCMMSTGGLV